ncbi:hypothetical protein AAFF_G00100760 [Aldrovandia affinis]|uniref:Uncharacterized protein n=1 Tax=Aldrovandia affinis TaxID=143900 RepID=A0AAD7RX98_9TELE|nr:hypothetical protein AAFF_G00100760 [Aldrovandia affinis]
MNKLYDTTQWLSRAGRASKLRFLIGILVRCDSVDILENTHKIVQVTLGKDFTYARSRQKPRVPDDLTTWSSDRAMEGKPLGTEVPKTWDWFSGSKYWVKANYILGLLSLCDTELLRALGNLIGVLIEKERRAFLQHDSESHYSFSPEDHPELHLLFHAGPSFPMLDLPLDVRDPDSAEIPPDSHQNSAPSKDCGEDPCPLKEAPCAGSEQPSYRRGVEERRGGSAAGTWDPGDPALTVVAGSSVSLSGSAVTGTSFGAFLSTWPRGLWAFLTRPRFSAASLCPGIGIS